MTHSRLTDPRFRGADRRVLNSAATIDTITAPERIQTASICTILLVSSASEPPRVRGRACKRRSGGVATLPFYRDRFAGLGSVHVIGRDPPKGRVRDGRGVVGGLDGAASGGAGWFAARVRISSNT